jgi:hypothetical protein
MQVIIEIVKSIICYGAETWILWTVDQKCGAGG